MEEVIADKAVEWQQILEQAFSMLHRAKETEGDQALQQVSLLQRAKQLVSLLLSSVHSS